MNTKDIIAKASAHLDELPGHVFDVLNVSKPVSPDAALNPDQGVRVLDGVPRTIAWRRRLMTPVMSAAYNALGQRVRKTAAGTEIRFIYGLGGELLAEIDATGAVRKEYIYLNDEPLAVLAAGSGTAAPTEQILDNTDSATLVSGDWTASSGVTGFIGTDYLYHAANGAPPGGIVVDNDAAVFTGEWSASTGVGGYVGADYRYHAANGAPPGGIIVDNTEATAVGTWTASSATSGYYGADYQHHAAGTGADSMTSDQ